MNPAVLLLEKLSLTGKSTSADWRFAHCVLTIIAENDSRAFRDTEYSNWVDDIMARIAESGVEDDTGAVLILKQLFAQVKQQLINE